MAGAFVAHLGSGGSANKASQTITSGSAVSVNATVFVATYFNAPRTVTSITDTKSNVYAAADTDILANADHTHCLWKCTVTTAIESGDVITVNASAKGGISASADAFSGITTNTDGDNDNTGTSSTPSVAISPSNATNLIYGRLIVDATGSPVPGYSADGDTNGGDSWHGLTSVDGNVVYKLTTSATTQTWNPTITSDEWAIALKAWKDDTAAGGVTVAWLKA